MSKLKVENFGPITSGFTEDDGFMDFRKVTVFIGNQGSGKSSVAKLFSTCSWLEKALFRGWIKPPEITLGKSFINHCHYLNLKEYFQKDSVIEYRGRAFTFVYRDEKMSISSTNTNNNAGSRYRVPKIMYVPAERNFLTAVDNPGTLKGIPKALSEFWDDLNRAQQELTGGLALPIGKSRFVYDKDAKRSQITGENAKGIPYKLRLSEASSGFQSFVPLYLVSRNLALSINKEVDHSRSELSGEERETLRTEIEQIVSNPKLSAEVKQTALEALSAKFKYEAFINIVEEPEQNLFPKSQQMMLYQLLEFANTTPWNELIITTHSPYIINYLTLAIKADEVKSEIAAAPQHEKLHRKLAEIVPDKATMAADGVIVYELTDKGIITRLPMYAGVPSDENDLNEALGETNTNFSNLLEIEQYARRS